MPFPVEFKTELPVDAISIRIVQSRIAGVLDELGFSPSDKIEVRLAVEAAIHEVAATDNGAIKNDCLMLSFSAGSDYVRIVFYEPQTARCSTDPEDSSQRSIPFRRNDTFMRALMSVVSYDVQSGQLVLEKHRRPTSQVT